MIRMLDPTVSFYSSPSCDGDHQNTAPLSSDKVSILPRLATGILYSMEIKPLSWFLFFPVLRRGSVLIWTTPHTLSFYSSPSCDGDRKHFNRVIHDKVSILPRLATGIDVIFSTHSTGEVSILPRLATGIGYGSGVRAVIIVSILPRLATGIVTVPVSVPLLLFLFFPVLRRGSIHSVKIPNP